MLYRLMCGLVSGMGVGFMAVGLILMSQIASHPFEIDYTKHGYDIVFPPQFFGGIGSFLLGVAVCLTGMSFAIIARPRPAQKVNTDD